jgi:O-antigen ligase
MKSISALQEAESPLFTIARISLIALLLAAPLAFGAVEAWAWGTMAVAVSAIVVLWALGCARSGTITFIWSPLYVPLLALLALAAVQFSAGLTADRIGTREALIKLVLPLLIFFLAQHLFAAATPKVWKASAAVVAIYTFVVSVFSILQFFVTPGILYGTIRPRWGGWVFGPYVNRNHYAGLMEILIPIAAGLALGLRSKHPARPFLLFAIFIAVVSLFLSGSRGGTIALSVESIIFAIAILRGGTVGHARNRALVTGCVLAALAGCCFLWLDPHDTWKRWETMAQRPELAEEYRIRLTNDSLHIARNHLAYGVGLGAFEVAYPRYQGIVTDLAIPYAHNDYAQFIAETGILGVILTPVSIAIFCWLAFRRLRSSNLQLPTHNSQVETVLWLQIGSAVGACGMLVHSLSDFNLHIPANAAWFAMSAALATLPGPAKEYDDLNCEGLIS